MNPLRRTEPVPVPPPVVDDWTLLADLSVSRDEAIAVVDTALARRTQVSRQDLVDALLDVRHTLSQTRGGGNG